MILCIFPLMCEFVCKFRSKRDLRENEGKKQREVSWKRKTCTEAHCHEGDNIWCTKKYWRQLTRQRMWLNWAVFSHSVITAAGISEGNMSIRDNSCNGDSCSKIATSSSFDSLRLQAPEQTIQPPILFEIFPINTQFLAQCLLVQTYRIFKPHYKI